MKARYACSVTAVLVAVFASSGCTDQLDRGEPDPAPVSDEGSPSSNKADYFGEDDRRDPASPEVTDRQRRWARATALVAEADDVAETDESGLTLESTPYREEKNLCEDAAFADQPVVPGCSSFLVDDDTVVTAGHCTSWSFSCEDARFVFDYGIYEEGEDPTAIDEEDVYQCAEVVAESYEGNQLEQLDYAVIRLDREVTDREPLEIRSEGRVDSGAHLALVGYPDGLPVKIDDRGVVFHTTEQRFVATNDSFGGHSGSAVVNLSTGKVEAVHVASGGDRFQRDEEADCRRAKQCREATIEGACQGSIGVHAEHWRPFVDGYEGSDGDTGPDGGGDAGVYGTDTGTVGPDGGEADTTADIRTDTR